MKKLVILILSILCLSSCNYHEEGDKKVLNVAPRAYHFTYDGHEYLLFDRAYSSPIHDPDCPCMIETD